MNTVAELAYELSSEQIAFFHLEGYLIVRNLLSPAEVDAIASRFAALADGSQPAPAGKWERDVNAADPLSRFPRVMHPHRWDELSKKMLLHPKVKAVLTQLLRDEPVATQSMYYFKPPSSRGQALHQDNFYLQVEPQTCIAAWMAIFVAWKRRCSSVSSAQGRGRFTSPEPSFFIASGKA